MILRLVRDAVWRSRQVYFLIVPLTAMLWTFDATGNMPVPIGLMSSMTFAYICGPLVSVATVGRREMRILPITDRDLWVTAWILSAVVIPLAFTAAQTLTVVAFASYTGSSAISLENLFFASLYCFAYAGALSPITPALGYSLGNIGSRRPRWLWITISFACGLMFLGGFGLPYYLTKVLPLTLNQFSWVTASALLACLALSVISFRWTPHRGGFVPAKVVEKPVVPGSHAKDPTRFADRLTGIPRLAWPHLTIWLVGFTGMVAAYLGYWAIIDSDTPLRTFLQNNGLLAFDTGFRDAPAIGSMWVVMTMAALMMDSPWKAFGRQLKVLPVTTNRVNALFLATPFALWTLIWLVLIVIHVAVVGALPDPLRADIFILLVGLGALGHALMFRYGRIGSFWLVVVIGPLQVMTKREISYPVPVEFILAGGGLIALVIAAFVNHRTLTRSTSSSKAYRQDSLPFGATLPNAPQ